MNALPEMIMLRIFTVLWLALGIAVAQQFEGQTFTVSLANVTGAQKAYFNIFDSAGGRTTLLNYFSFPNGRRQDSTGVKRAIIYVHGADSNPNQYFSRILAALKKATASNPAVTEQSVALLAPYFSVDARAPAGSNALTWQSDIGFGIRGWSTGRNSVNPTGQPVSSFEVLDQIITYFNDASIYPNLNEVVVAGHSMGAQMLQRYAAVGKVLPLRVPLVYWIGNPSSYAWLNTSRPITSTCATYDDWNQGLSNYDIEYEKEFVETQGVDAVRARYFSRNIAYARGLNDFGDSSKGDCAPFTTGANRGERFNRFQAWFPADDGDTVDYVAGVGHNDAQMTTHASGVARLFLDNFEGDGSRMPNFGTQGPNTRP